MIAHPVGCYCPQHSPTMPVDSAKKARLLWIALGLIGGFSVVELLVSLSSGSLALLAEAGHMISDCGALAIALLATWVARFPASARAPFGYRRVEILAALVNGLGLVAIALWVGFEAITRLQAPASDIVALPMLLTAIAGLGVNLVNIALLHNHSHHDLNLKGAFLHMVADAAGSVGVIIAAIAVWAWGWAWADSAISLVVAVFILIGAIPLVRQSLNVLLETTPSHLDAAQVQAALEAVSGVLRVEQMRVWAIAPGQEAIAARFWIDRADGAARDRLLKELHALLQSEFGIADIFLELRAPVLPNLVSLSQPASLDQLATMPVPLSSSR